MKIDVKTTVKSYAIITMGSVIYALAFDLFYAPNDVALGGITGLAQVINHVFPMLPVGILTIAMNIPLFLLGWKYIGFQLLVGSLASMCVWWIEKNQPIPEDELVEKLSDFVLRL